MRRRNGIRWGELIVGALLLLLGVFTLLWPEHILTGAVVIYGLIAVVLGVEDILVYMRLARFAGLRPVLSLITGILSVMCGVMLLANPDAGKWALTVLFPIWFLAHCISGLTNAGLTRLLCGRFYYGFTLTLNILGLFLGFLMLLSPALSFLTLRSVAYLAALYLILFGGERIVLAFLGGNDEW